MVDGFKKFSLNKFFFYFRSIDSLPAIFNKTAKKEGKTEVSPEIGFDLGYKKEVHFSKKHTVKLKKKRME